MAVCGNSACGVIKLDLELEARKLEVGLFIQGKDSV